MDTHWVSPVSVYLIAHPDCPGSAALADGLYRWLRLVGGPEAAPEAGLPVWRRAQVVDLPGADGAAAPTLHPPIAWDEARLNVLVVLCGDALVVDPRWWSALEGLLAQVADRELRGPATAGGAIGRALVLPVGVSEAVGRLGFLTLQRQLIRLPPGGAAREVATTGEAADPRLRALRRAVMEATLRRLPACSGRGLAPGAPPPAPPVLTPRVKVFLSHAKKGGRHIAERLRDGLATMSQLEPWFDANDLPPGAPWSTPMTAAARDATDGLIAIVTDAYHSRFWCQREAQHARQPRPLSADRRLWGVQPTVALLATAGGARRPVPALDGVLHIGWRTEGVDGADAPIDPARAAGGAPALEPAAAGAAALAAVRRARAMDEAIEDTVEWWLLEALLARVAERRARDVLARAPGPGLALLTFTPDPYTLGRLLGAWRRHARGLPARICFPGHGLPRAGRERLLEVLYDHGYDAQHVDEVLTPLELLVHDPALWSAAPLPLLQPPRATDRGRSPGGDAPAAPACTRVALSAGGDDRELAAAGVGLVHLDDLLVRLSRALLDRRITLAFGGLLRSRGADPGPHNLTEPLLLAAQGWVATEADAVATGAVAPTDRLRSPPLLNLVPWTPAGGPDLRFRADRAGACGFVDVLPPDKTAVELAALVAEAEGLRADLPLGASAGRVKGRERERRALAEQLRWAEADALTAMRAEATRRCAARVLMGGKIAGARGWLPGVAEELEASLWAHASPEARAARRWEPAFAQPALLLGGFGGVCGLMAGYLTDPAAPYPSALDPSLKASRSGGDSEPVAMARQLRRAALARALAALRAHLHDLSDGDPVFPAAAWSHAAFTRRAFFDLLTVASPAAALRQVGAALAGLAPR